MFYLSLIIVIAILIIGSVKMWDFYLEDESLKLLLTFIGTIIIATITTIFLYTLVGFPMLLYQSKISIIHHLLLKLL